MVNSRDQSVCQSLYFSINISGEAAAVASWLSSSSAASWIGEDYLYVASLSRMFSIEPTRFVDVKVAAADLEA